jgi:hypothetical protein
LSSPSPARLFSKVDQHGGARESPARLLFKNGTKARLTMTSNSLRTKWTLASEGYAQRWKFVIIKEAQV